MMIAFIFTFVFAALAFSSTIEGRSPQRTWTFENIQGTLPDGFVAETTNPRGPEAVWCVLNDATAPSGSATLGIVCARQGLGSAYNLCWTRRVSIATGSVEVRLLPRNGREDRGGGPAWRVLDKNNYYVARWNPLENNLRVYYVKNGRRVQIAGAEVDADPKKWHTIRIEFRGDLIRGFFDGIERLEVRDDTFSHSGGVGVWTKADAETSFDDLSVVRE